MVKRALRSVMEQTILPLEIIVVDDGSEDNTPQELCSLVGKLPDTVRILITSNQGASAARNAAIKMARGRYIAFLDSDDHWQKKKLEMQYQLMAAHPHYLVSHTKEKWLRRGKHLNQKNIHIPRHGDIFGHCLKLCAVGMSTVMVDSRLFPLVGFFDESMPCCEDFDFWLRVSARYRFLLLDQALTVKEGGREDQLSHIHRVGMDKWRIASLIKILEGIPLSPTMRSEVVKEIIRKATIYGNGCIKHGRILEGRHYKEMASIYGGGK